MKEASKIIIYGDGGSRGNPGQAAYGFAIFSEDNKPIYSEGGRIGINTNNVAEYMAVIQALRYVISNLSTVSSIHFKLDSLLVVSQMEGRYKVKHPSMKELFTTAQKLRKELQAQIIFTQIPRSQNTVADTLVNNALDFKI